MGKTEKKKDIKSFRIRELKSAILAIFHTGPGWLCTVNAALKISKIIFTLGVDEFLAMLEGKIRVTPFF